LRKTLRQRNLGQRYRDEAERLIESPRERVAQAQQANAAGRDNAFLAAARDAHRAVTALLQMKEKLRRRRRIATYDFKAPATRFQQRDSGVRSVNDRCSKRRQIRIDACVDLKQFAQLVA
jgi:hypothetical protein